MGIFDKITKKNPSIQNSTKGFYFGSSEAEAENITGSGLVDYFEDYLSVIVVNYPLLGNISYFFKIIKKVNIKYLFSEGLVEPFNKSVLCRFSRLYVFEFDFSDRTPFSGKFGHKFRTVVHAYLLARP
jgi:hypothetical protein